MPRSRTVDADADPQAKVRIMDAAARLFADKGFEATSISDITEASGAGRSLIYYFQDKRALYEAILQDGSDRIAAAAQAAYDYDGSAIQRLRLFVERFRQLNVESPDLARIVIRAEFEGNISFNAQRKEHLSRPFALLERVFREGVMSGELRETDPMKAAHMVMGLVHSLAVMHIQGEADPDPAQDVDFAMGILAHGLACLQEPRSLACGETAPRKET